MRNKGYDVISVGSATIDVFVNTHSDEIVRVRHHKTEEILTCYPLGSKILIKKLQFTTGGGGTNTAVSFSRLGLKTAYVGGLGNDPNGKKIISELKEENIDFIGTITKGQTNYSVILDSIKHDRTILAYKDASSNLDFRDIPKKSLKSRCFYFSSMMGRSFMASLMLMRHAKNNGIKVAFNPSSYEVESERERLRPCLGCTDILIFNREEAALLLQKPQNNKIEDLLAGVRKLGPKLVVITDGPKGAWCSDGIHIYCIKPRKVKVVETTGAGDAFASGFVTGIIKKMDIESAMRLGLTQAESVIQHYGAKNKLLRWNEAMKEMRKCPKASKKKA